MFRVKSLYIDNFKAFKNFNLDFNKSLTVMVGFNGTGKTTVLESVYNILSERYEYFLKYNQFTYIELVIVQDNENFKIRVEKIANSIQTKLNDKVVNNLSEYLKSPKIIYVPTEVNFLNIETKGVNKLSGEEEKNIILNSERMSKQLKQFLVNEKYNDLNDIAEGNPEKAVRLDRFKVLYNNFFEDKEFIGIDNQTFEPQFRIKESGKLLKVEDLSAGEKQIFFRGGSLLQNSDKNVLVLLDEPEISMHPEWQQKILEFYKSISQNAQYIISTHSPHIAICTLLEEIRVFEKKDDKIVIKEIDGAYGRTVSDVLTSIFDLETLRNADIEKDIQEYKKLYFDKNLKSEVEKERFNNLEKKLKKYLDPNDPDIALLKFENDTRELKEKLKKLVGDDNA